MKNEYRVVKKYGRNGLGKVDCEYEILHLFQPSGLGTLLGIQPHWGPLKRMVYHPFDSYTCTVSFQTEKEAFQYINDITAPVPEDEIVPHFVSKNEKPADPKYPICPECGCNTLAGFTPPKAGMFCDGDLEKVDWGKAHLYCTNGETNCKFNTRFIDLTTPRTEKKYSLISK